MGIEEAAREWGVARREAIDAKRDRNAHRCDNEEEGKPYNYAACWHMNLEAETWCQECKDRQAAHLRYRTAAVRKGAAMRRLARLVEPAGLGVTQEEAKDA